MGRTTVVGRLRTWTAPLVALALVAAACGGDDDAEPDATAPAVTPAPDATDGADAPDATDAPAATDAPGEPDGAASTGGTIVVGVETETAGWDPPNGLIGFSGRMVNHVIYGSLTTARPDGSYAPYLAESVTGNDDSTEWTIVLREGITFHDGTPFDAEAVKFSMDRVRDPDAAVGSAFAYIDDIVVDDELTLRLLVSTPQAQMPQILSDALGNITSPTAVAELGDEFNNSPVGAGPYRFVEWLRDDHLTVERYDDFFLDDRAFADRITFRPIPDDASRSAALRAGDVDIIVTQSPTEIVQFRDDDAFRLTEIPFGATGLLFNLDVVDDIRLREAVARGIDRDVFIDLVWSGVGEPYKIPIPPDSPWYVDVDVPDYDPDGAMALVAEYEADTGEPARFELMVGTTQVAADFGAALQDQLRQVGIEVVVGPPVDPDTSVGRLIDGDFEASISNHGGLIDPWFEYTRRYTPGGLINISNLEDDVIAENLEIGAASTDVDERLEAYHTVIRRVAESLDTVYIRSGAYAIISTPAIEGLGTATNPDGTPSLGNYFTPILMDELWRSDG